MRKTHNREMNDTTYSFTFWSIPLAWASSWTPRLVAIPGTGTSFQRRLQKVKRAPNSVLSFVKDVIKSNRTFWNCVLVSSDLLTNFFFLWRCLRQTEILSLSSLFVTPSFLRNTLFWLVSTMTPVLAMNNPTPLISTLSVPGERYPQKRQT